jgi:hypothetical protein
MITKGNGKVRCQTEAESFCVKMYQWLLSQNMPKNPPRAGQVVIVFSIFRGGFTVGFFTHSKETIKIKISSPPKECHSAALHTTEFYTQSSGMACYWRLPSHRMNNHSCSWVFLLKPWVWRALLSFHHRAKHVPPKKKKLIWNKLQSRRCSLGLCVLYYCILSTHNSKDEKRERLPVFAYPLSSTQDSLYSTGSLALRGLQS